MKQNCYKEDDSKWIYPLKLSEANNETKKQDLLQKLKYKRLINDSLWFCLPVKYVVITLLPYGELLYQDIYG